MHTLLRAGMVVLLLGLVTCGGGGGTATADLTGAWWVTRYEAGVALNPLHLSMLQTGAEVRCRFTCNGDIGEGAGTYAAGALHVEFPVGGGTLFLDAQRAADGLEGTYTIGAETGALTLERTETTLDCSRACDPVTPTRFVGTHFTELDKIERISLFRSAAGHSYTDACESCRSMKHYYAPYPAWRANGVIEVRSPVDGLVVIVRDDGHGASPGDENKQVHIRPTAYPAYTFVLFHVDLTAPAIEAGDVVVAGQAIGTARLEYPDLSEVADNFDIGVQLHTPYGERFVSWFDVVTDTLFANYASRGVTSRDALVLTEAQRDVDPLTCDGETFTSTGSLDVWRTLGAP